MPTSRVCVLVNLPPEPLWDTLSDYRTWNMWLDNVNDSEIEDGIQTGPPSIGNVRAVGDPQNPRARERLIVLDDRKLEITYTALGSLPFPARNYIGTAKLIPLTDVDQTVVEWTGVFDADQADEEEVRTVFQTLHRKFVDFLERGALKVAGNTAPRGMKLAFELRQQEPADADPRNRNNAGRVANQ